ncbi:MarR family winged helix-turn-helix transcriptional regulator [Microbulbifer sp. SSSA007]|uniref:MarR family winged helix-turn-helix transcriptional regulator n=1 Tax=Microbulbifer sp. SSSA007 TaxID=3243379 RepID=UPI00403A6CD8
MGTRLRHLLELLDGDVSKSYSACGIENYKPRYTPVMRTLMQKGDVTIGEIVASAQLSQPAVSQTVKDMVKQELVEIVKGVDARERKVRLTHKGALLLPRLKAHWQATVSAEKSLNAELPLPLSDLLDTAINALERSRFQDRIQRQLPEEIKKQ